MAIVNLESLAPQLRLPGRNFSQTACGMRGLVAAGSSSAQVVWLCHFLGTFASPVKRRCNVVRNALLTGCMRM